MSYCFGKKVTAELTPLIEELRKEFDEKIANGIPVKEVEKEKNEDDENEAIKT